MMMTAADMERERQEFREKALAQAQAVKEGRQVRRFGGWAVAVGVVVGRSLGGRRWRPMKGDRGGRGGGWALGR